MDLELCRPTPAAAQRPLELNGFRVEPGDKLVTYVARDLEPYRGFHILMRALPRLLRLRRDLKVVMVGGDGVSYGARLAGTTWREHMLARGRRTSSTRRACASRGKVRLPDVPRSCCSGRTRTST